MSCTKNRKKFLFFNYLGDHKFELTNIGVHMVYVSTNFKTEETCTLCGLVERSCFVGGDSLMQRGVSAEGLEIARGKQI